VELAGQNPAQQAEIAYVRGRCEIAQNQLEKAGTAFRQAAETPSADPFLRAASHSSLAYCFRESGHFDDAAVWYEKAWPEFAALGALPFEEQALGNLGYVYFEVGDMPRAREDSQKAVSMADELNLRGDLQIWQVNLGRAEDNLGEYGAAEKAYQAALDTPSPPGSPIWARRALHNLVRLAITRNHIADAERYHQKEGDQKLQGDDFVNWRLDGARIAELKGQYKEAETALRQMIVEAEALPEAKRPNFRVMFWMQIQLARVYADQKKDSDAVIWFEKGIDTVMRAAAKIKSPQARAALLSSIPVYDDYVAFLVDRRRTAKSLRVAQAGRAQTLAQGLGYVIRNNESPEQWLARIQTLLRREKATILSYFLSQKDSYLWVVTPEKAQAVSLGVTGRQLEDLIDRYRGEISHHQSMESSSAAQQLFSLLLEPANALLAKDSHVIIVADSKLYSVNFEALISPHGGLHYWIEDVAVENVSSLDLWMAGANARRAAAKGLFLIGAAVEADPHFPALPNAPREMDAVARYFDPRKVTRVSGAAATRNAYMASALQQFKDIYVAAHGTSNAVDPMNSAIILSPERGGNYKLLASDIAGKKLNADLVTISACEGAGKNLQSLEGLLGLEWAFLRAGAHRVIAGLWDIDDASTPDFMNNVYQELTRGRDAIYALRTAKLAMLHSGDTAHQHPYYWASLQLYTGA
jgi:CHAT domain-containing protein